MSQESPQSLKRLYEQCRAQQQWPEAAGALLRLEPQIETAREKSDLLCELGEIYAKHLRERDLAIQSYIKALELDYEKTYLLDRLGDLYAEKKEDFNDVVAHLERQAVAAPDAPTRHRLWHETGEIYRSVLGKPDQAQTNYQKILLENPAHDPAVEALETLYVDTQRWAELIHLYEAQIEHHRQDQSRVTSLLFKMATLFKDKLDEPFEAMERYEKILEIAPNNLQAKNFVTAFLDQITTWQRVALATLEKAEHHKNRGQQILYFKKAAKILFQYLENKSEGLAVYRRLLTLAPEDPEPLEILERFYSQQEDWTALLGVYEEMSALPVPQTLQAHLQNRMGEIFQNQLRLPQKAIQAFNRALQADPGHRKALDALEALCWENKDWSALPEILQRQIAFSDDPRQKAAIHHKRGKLFARHLNDPGQAVSAYEDVLKINPAHTETLYALETLYLEAGNYKNLREVYSQLLHGVQDPARQLDLLKKQAKLLIEHFQDEEKALQLLKRARTLFPQDVQIPLDLEALLLGRRDWPALLELYEDQAGRARSAGAAVAWWRKAGDIYERQVADLAKARAAYEKALERDPDDLKTLRHLQHLCERTQNWAAFLDYGRKELALQPASRPEQLPLLLRMAETFEHRLGKMQDAIPFYEQALLLDERHATALQSLERIFLRLERWTDLLRIYERQAAGLVETSAGGERQAQLYRRIAALYLDKLPNPQQAALYFEKILTLNPQDQAVLQQLKTLYLQRQKWQELIATLEHEIAQTPRPAEKAYLYLEIAGIHGNRLANPKAALEVLQNARRLNPDDETVFEALAAAYEKSADWKTLLTLLEERRGQLPPTSPALVTLLERMAGIHETRLRETQQSSALYEEILLIDPANAKARQALEHSYTALKAWDRLQILWQSQLQRARADFDKAALHLQLGALKEEQLKQDSEALDHYRLAYELNPADAAALSSICRILKHRQNWGDYLRYSQLEIDGIADKSLKASRLLENAEIWEKQFHHPQKAIEHLNMALRLHPASQDGLQRLWDLQLAAKNWEAALDSGHKLLALTKNPEVQIDVRVRMGEIYADHLQDDARAATSFQEALALSPRNEAVLARYKILQSERGNWPSVVSIIHQLIALSPSREEKIDLLYEAAVLELEKLQAQGPAMGDLQELLAIDPLHEKALDRLGQAGPDASAWIDAQKRVLKALEADEPHPRVVRSLHVLARHWVTTFHNPSAAADCLSTALDLAPHDLETLAQLATCYEQLGQWHQAVDTLERRIKDLGEDRAAKEDLRRLAAIYEKSLDKTDQAITVLERLLVIDPQDLRTYADLEPLLLKRNRWDELAGLYQRQEPLLESAQDKAAALLKLGDLAAVKLHDLPQAQSALEAALRHQPRLVDALARLADLHIQSGEFKKAVEIQRQWVKSLDYSPQAIEVYLRMAGILRDQLHDTQQARDACLKALELDPRHLATLRLLEEIYEEQSDWMNLLKTYQREATLFLDEKREIFLYRAMARLWEERFQDTEKAGQSYRRALTLASDEDSVWEEVTGFYRRIKSWKDLIQAYEHRLQHMVLDPKTHFALLYETACLHMDVPVNPQTSAARAVVLLEKVLDLQSHHPEALERLIQLHFTAGAFEPLLETLERKLALSGATADSLEILHEAAWLWRHRLSVPSAAEDTYLRILQINPRDYFALDQLQSLYLEQGRIQAYAPVLERLVPLTENEGARAALHEKLALVYQNQLSDLSAAAIHYEHWLSLAPDNAAAFTALEALYQAAQQWPAYINLLETHFEKSPKSEDRFQTAVRIAQTYLQHLHHTALAVEWYERALKTKGLTKQPAERLAVLQALRPLYRQEKNWTALVETLAQMTPLIEAPQERATILLEQAEIEGELCRDDAAAMNSLRALLETLSHHPEGIRRLINLLDPQDDREELNSLYLRLLELEKDPPALADVHYRYALLHGHRDPERRSHLQKALDLQPRHRQALQALRKIEEEQLNISTVVTLLEREAELTDVVDEKWPLYLEIGRLASESLDDDRKAITYFEKALQLDSKASPAMAALAALYFKKQDWANAERYYQHLSLRLTMPSEKDAELYHRLGWMALHQGRADDALLRFQQALQCDPMHRESLQQLSDLYLSRKQWKPSVALLETLLKVLQKASTTSDQITSVHSKLGAALYHVSMESSAEESAADDSSADKSRRHLLNVVQNDPQHIQAWQWLAELALQKNDPTDAIAALDELIQKSKDIGLRVKSLCQKSQILSVHSNDDEGALACLIKAQALDGDDPDVLDHLAALYEKRKQWPEALKMLDHRRNTTTKPAQRGEMSYRQGRIYSQQIGDQNEAIRHLQETLEDLPAHLPSILELAAIHRSREHWDQLCNHLRYALKVLPSEEGELISKLEFELADLLINQLHTFDDAEALLQKILARSPEHQKAQLALARLHAGAPEGRRKAISEYLKILNQDPGSLEAYREAYEIFLQQRAHEHSHVFHSILEFLGEKDLKPPAHPLPAKKLFESHSLRLERSPEIAGLLQSGEQLEPLAQLLVLLSPHIDKLLPAVKRATGLVNLKQEIMFRSAAKFAGIDDLKIDIAESDLPTTSPIVVTAANTIVIDSHFEKFSDTPQERFYMAQACFTLWSKTYIALQFPGEKLKWLLLAVLRHFHPNLAPSIILNPEFQEHHKQFKKLLTRNLKKDLQDAAARLAPEIERLDVDAFYEKLTRSNDRLCLIMTQQPAVVLAVLMAAEHKAKKVSAPERLRWLQQSSRARELIKFTLSEDYLTLRRKVGLALTV